MGKFMRFDLSYNLKRKCIINESLDRLITDSRKIYLLPRKLYNHDLHPGMHKYQFDTIEGEHYFYIESSLGLLRINNSNSLILERGDMDKTVYAYEKMRYADNANTTILENTVNDKLDMLHVCGDTRLVSSDKYPSRYVLKNLESINIESHALTDDVHSIKTIKLNISLNNIDNRIIDSMLIKDSKGFVIKRTGSTNIINPYNMQLTEYGDSYNTSVFYVENELAKYSKNLDIMSDKMASYAFNDLINKENHNEGICLASGACKRGRGFLIKVPSSRATTINELTRYLDALDGINVVFPLEKVLYPIESLIGSNIPTYYGGTIIRNENNTSLSYFFKAMM